jgi:hypothetical protein
MRCLLACLVPFAVLAAADPDPAVFIPADAAVSVRAPDLTRSRTRWATAPYARLLSTGWGRTLLAEWGGRLDQAAPGAAQALAGLRAAAGGARIARGELPEVTLAVAGVADPLRAAAAALLPESRPGQADTQYGFFGRATQYGSVLAWATGQDGAVQPASTPAALVDGEADLQVDIDQAAWAAGMGTAMLAGTDGGTLHVSLRLDPVGLRETMRVPPTPATRLAAVSQQRWADPEELHKLPATTLWAATWSADPAAIKPLLDTTGDAGVQRLEGLLAEAGLPAWRDTLAAMDGPATLWMAEGVPFPSLTLAVSMQEEAARRWIAAATTRLNLVPNRGGVAGFVGLLPCAIGWVGTGTGGRLVVSTDPNGLDAWRLRKPGFATHVGVRAVLAEAPKRTVLLGASRGGASWAAIAQLAVPIFTAMGAPQAVSLPGDLRGAADRGWLYMQLEPDGGTLVESGGVFGGPFTVSLAAGIAVPATMWLQRELQPRLQGKPVQPAPDGDPAPVF